MKDLKDIILDRRIRNLEIEGKQVPDKYISVFNSYLEQIAETLTDYTKQVRKEVCDRVYNVLTTESIWRAFKKWWLNNGECKELRQLLDQIEGEDNEKV